MGIKIDGLVKLVSGLKEELGKMDKKVDGLLADLTKRVSVCESNQKIFNKKLLKMEKDLEAATSKNTQLEKTLADNADAATKRIKAAEKATDDLIETSQRLRNLRVDQLPEVPGESLAVTVRKLFAMVGCQLDDRTRFYRLKMGRSNGTTIVNFATEAEKEIFFFNYVKVAKNLKVVSFLENHEHPEARVYVSHDLCQTQYQVWKELSKVKEGIIKNARIHRGYVYVRTADDKPPQRIQSLDVLKELVNKF